MANKTKKLRAGDTIGFSAITVDSPGVPDPIDWRDADPEAGKVAMSHRGRPITWDAEAGVNIERLSRELGENDKEKLKKEKLLGQVKFDMVLAQKQREDLKKEEEEQKKQEKSKGIQSIYDKKDDPYQKEDIEDKEKEHDPDKTSEIEKDDFIIFKKVRVSSRKPHDVQYKRKDKVYRAPYEYGVVEVIKLPLELVGVFAADQPPYGQTTAVYNDLRKYAFRFPPLYARQAFDELSARADSVEPFWREDGTLDVEATFKEEARSEIFKRLIKITKRNFSISEMPINSSYLKK